MLSPFTNYLRSFGVGVEPGLARAKLPVACLDNHGMYVASHAFWNFGYKMERKEGIEGLGFLAGEFAGADLVAASFRRVLETAPTLYQGMFLLQKELYTETSGTQVNFTQFNNGNLRIFYSTTFGPEHPGYDTFILFALSGLLEIIRVYAGSDWTPSKIGLRLKHPPERVLREKLPQTKINVMQYNYIDVDAASLGSPPVFRVQNNKNLLTQTDETSALDLRNSVRKLLAGYNTQNPPGIELIAEFSSISVRTLQRRLSETGSNFRVLLNEAKYQSAICLLQSTTLPIADIAQQLGYGNPTHFSRAFARIAGVSPGIFRKNYLGS